MAVSLEKESLMPTRTAILSDIHGNSPALRAVLADVRQMECARIFLLGDVINGYDPHGCLDLLRSLPNLACLKGNAEFYLLTPDLEALPPDTDPDIYNVVRLVQWFRAHLTAEDLAWLQSWPDRLYWERAILVHDSPLDRLFPQDHYLPGVPQKYQEFLFHARGFVPDTPAAEWQLLLDWMEAQHITQVYCAHTHVPFCRSFGDRLVCNSGSVGLPLDGDPRGSWLLVEESPAQAAAVTIRRVPYDLDQILALVDRTPDYPDADLPNRKRAYKLMLQTGTHWRTHI